MRNLFHIQVAAWLTSSGISILLSMFILQPAKAIMGSFVASITTTAVAASAMAALMLSTEVAA